jgi:medium-chain acyl-[acyl-carrier-protein] hydrolase
MQQKIPLFCFPYAGGSSQIFSGWSHHLPREINVIAMEYPGHGKLFNQPLLYSVKDLVSHLLPNIQSHAARTPFYLFGHSLGALIAFELTRQMRKSHHPLPARLIVSGASAPQCPDREPLSVLSDDEFITKVINKYEGFEADIKDNQELRDLFLPILRADFIMSESYVCEDEPPLDCLVTVIRGMKDSLIIQEELEGWQVHSTRKTQILTVPGDHFSLFRDPHHKAALLTHLAHLF